MAINNNGWIGWMRVLAHLGVQAVLLYRYGSWVHRLRIPIVRHILAIPYWILRFVQMLGCSVSISQRAEIGPGFVVHTWGGVFVPPIKAGRNLYVQHGVVIGHSVRSIGDNVYFGPGSKAYGFISIGSDVNIGANSVVNFSVPDKHMVHSPVCRAVPLSFFAGGKYQQAMPEEEERARSTF